MALVNTSAPGLKADFSPIVKVLAGGLIVVGLYYGGRWIYKTIQRNQIERDAAGSLGSPAGLAKRIHAAGHTGWLGMTEDEDEILRIATEICDLKAVAAAYKAMYSDELLDKLESWLSHEQYLQFIAIIDANKVAPQCSGLGRADTFYMPMPGVYTPIYRMAAGQLGRAPSIPGLWTPTNYSPHTGQLGAPGRPIGLLNFHRA